MNKRDKEKLTGGNDIIFKSIMYLNKEIFKSILETILEIKIEKISYLSPEMPIRHFLEKGKRLDIYIETIDAYIDVEVTQKYGEYIKNRNIAFECKLYCETVQKGDNYELYKKVNLINLIFNKKNSEEIVIGKLRNQEGKEISNMLTYSEIYIENFLQMYYNEEEEKIKKYKYLIMLGLNKEKLKIFSKKYGDDKVKEYEKVLNKIIEDGGFEPLFSKEEDERRIRNTERNIARREGHAEGMKEGMKEEKIEIAKRMILKEKNIEEIIDITDLSKEEIQHLQNKLL